MSRSAGDQWRESFSQTLRRHETAKSLRPAALKGRLGEWTKALTTVVVDSCTALGWDAAAKGHALERMPAPRQEYLALDVMAFAPGAGRWQFPTAVMELENSRDDDRIAFSLWKVLCVRADLRVVFCYRPRAEQAGPLVRKMRDEVVKSLGLASRTKLRGETWLAVGSRADIETLTYGFFRWWRLDTNTGNFRLIT